MEEENLDKADFPSCERKRETGNKWILPQRGATLDFQILLVDLKQLVNISRNLHVHL